MSGCVITQFGGEKGTQTKIEDGVNGGVVGRMKGVGGSVG